MADEKMIDPRIKIGSKPFQVTQQTQGALSRPQVDVLRKIVTDSTFRTNFFTDPIKAVGGSDISISANELAVLERLSAAQYEAVANVINANFADKAADGTHTLAYAVAFAVVVALLVAMPDPGSLANQIKAISKTEGPGGIQ